MSLRIVIGRANSDKSKFVMDEIKEQLNNNPLGKPIFYIVPEQMTFQQEYNLLNGNVRGSIRAQVVSFSRLAWRVLQETGGSTRQFITSTGIQMMLRKIVNQRVEPFKMFQKAVDKQGFIQEIEGIITEFKRHCITPDLLLEQLNYTKENITLSNKLSDLHYIYAQLTELLQDKYIDGEDQLLLLTEKIAHTTFLEQAEVFVDGFHRFTPKELGILVELLKVAKRVTITLTTDPIEVSKELSELDLFYQTTETYLKLIEVAKENDIVIESPVYLQENDLYKNGHPSFVHLEKHFDERPTPPFQLEEKIPIKI